MVVQHNLTAMNANRYLGINNSKLSKSLEKLSSGYAINRAGDNAAGLAVSEKMRSQIAGMTQAVKNAQDGISMVQTFEGALTETDSILQRMKTLADQMANGTYDDPVDRTAAQQEFLQLNDELDQIADTDFNGVTVLNGGVMSDGKCADGVKAEFGADGHVTKKTVADDYKGGVIDYTKNDAPAAAAKDPSDISANAKLDDSKWTQDDADKLWQTLGITTDQATEVTVTFEYDGNGGWTAKSADVEGAKATALTPTPTTNGGFSVTGDTHAVNAVVDTIDAVKGDMVAIKFTNNKEAPVPPTNIGFSDTTTDDGIKLGTVGAGLNGLDEDTVKATTIALDKGVATDFATDTDIQAGIEALNGAKITATYQGAAAAGNATVTYTTDADAKLKVDANGIITWDKADGTTVTLGTITGPNVTADAGSGASTATVDYVVNVAGYKIPAGAGGFDADIGTAAAGDAADSAYAVSKSDAFGKSQTKMTYTNNITLQVGARTKDAVNFTFKYASTSIGNLKADLDCTAYGLGTNVLNLNTQEDANKAIDKIDQAINKVSLVRGTFGAIQNRLEHKIDNLNVSVENLTSAESQIRDTNMPQEMMNFTKQQILAQASQSMLAQANQLPQSVLSLLQ